MSTQNSKLYIQIALGLLIAVAELGCHGQNSSNAQRSSQLQASKASPELLQKADAVMSPSGKWIVYAVADGSDAKSEVWISKIDGGRAHRVSTSDEDAMMPAFGKDDSTLFYAISRFNGHYSPIARPRKHEFDVVKIALSSDEMVVGTPIELTQQHFFDLNSLSVSPDGERFLVSTSGYPIGSLLEEFDVNKPLRIKRIFQPHVPNEPKAGPILWKAFYTSEGMNIVFAAASEGTGNFDYNIYQMSSIMGAGLTQLTRLSGPIDNLSLLPNEMVLISQRGTKFRLDLRTGQISPA